MARFVALALLYFTQGLPYGFFALAVPVLLNRDHPAEIVGLSSLLAIPWFLKFLWAPFVDRVRGGRLGPRRSVILPLQALTAGALFALGSMRPSPDHLTPLVVGFVVVSFLSATQDIAADGLTIDVCAPEERARAGAIQTGAYRLGMIAGGGGVLAIADQVGYREGFYLMACMVLVSSVPLLAIHEPPRPLRGTAPISDAPMTLLTSFFRSLEAKGVFFSLLCFKLGDALAGGMASRWYVKQGLTTAEIAYARGLLGGVAGVAGAALGAWAAGAIGKGRALVTFAVLQTSAIAMYVVLALAHPVGQGPLPLGIYQAASVVEHTLGGAATGVLFAHMMDRCRDASRATDFTVQASLLVAVTGIGIVASGFIVGQVGLTGLFVVATLAGLLAPLGARRMAAVRPRI